MRRVMGVLLGLFLTVAAYAQVTPEDLQALEARLQAMEAQLREIQAEMLQLRAPPDPEAAATTPTEDLAEAAPLAVQAATYTPSGPITATAGQTIKRVRIAGVSGGCIKVSNVDDVTHRGRDPGRLRRPWRPHQQRHRHKIVNSRITPKRTKTTLDTENGVYIIERTDVLIQGNVFRDFESGVEVAQSDDLPLDQVVGNYSREAERARSRGASMSSSTRATGTARSSGGAR